VSTEAPGHLSMILLQAFVVVTVGVTSKFGQF